MSLTAPDRFELEHEDEIRYRRGSRGYKDDDTHTDGTYDSDVDGLDPLHGETNAIRGTSSSVAWLEQSRKRLSFGIPGRFACSLFALFTLALSLLLFIGGFWTSQDQPRPTPEEPVGLSEPWYPTPAGGRDRAWRDAYSKAAELVHKMTLVEKVNITTGTGWQMGMCVGNTGAVTRLGFPSLCLQDGPLGLRFTQNTTAFPAGITVGATWNKRLMYLRGEAHGYEARRKRINILLGPSMGPIGRIPHGGRNWEGFGADPVLQGIAAAETIKGIQSQGVIATAKHWIGNEQEHFRQSREWGTVEAISSNIEDRALHEIYAWPFADSVRAGVGSVMCSYQQVNGSYACQNSKLLNGVLKDELGFQGFVQSDWLAQRSGVASALAGLDMTMPGDGIRWQDGKSLWGAELSKAVLNGSVPLQRFNDMVVRIVAAWYQMGQDDETKWSLDGPNFSSWTDEEYGQLHPGSPDDMSSEIVNKNVPVRVTEEGGDHDALARRIAAEGIVLVKNDGVLPLKRDGSNVKSRHSKVKIGIFGEDAFLNPAGNNACEDRACNVGTLAMGWGSGAVNLPYLSEPAAALRSAFDSNAIDIAEIKTNDDANTASIAAEQDLCMVFVNSDAGEGYLSWQDVHGDRNDLYPQNGGDALVERVADNCGGSTLVVLHTVGPTILEKWIDNAGVKAVLVAHLSGQESGNAIADIVFGYINPSGRLPYTIARQEADYGTTILKDSNDPIPQQDFDEGLFIDYRAFDKHDITPRYEFGYGLSYTTFRLSNLSMQDMGLNTTLPHKRYYYPGTPPRFSHVLPPKEEALLPDGFSRLSKFIYPYIDSVEDVKEGQYPWPKGYQTWHAPSAAGGRQGGNIDLWSVALELSVDASNIGAVAGDCVLQVYVSLPDHLISGEPVGAPKRVLRAFDKITLGTGRADNVRNVKFDLTRRDMSFWDVVQQNWHMPFGMYEICIGFSSRDLPECVNWEFTANHTMSGASG